MQTVRQIIGLNTTAGDIGVEIEVEARNPLPESGLPKVWLAERDGSLRGYSMEYITRGPVGVDSVQSNLDRLSKCISDHGSRINHSFRAGVHIHLNVQELNPVQVGHVAAVYYCLEDALVRYCGENRVGNHFCLRIRDAEYPLIALCDALSTGHLLDLGTDNLRYSSLNLRALTRYGSLEFRGMETMPDFSKIANWSKMLHNIKRYAMELSQREVIAYDISSDGPENWARTVLGDDLFEAINYEGFERSVMSCLRRVQQLIYLREDESRFASQSSPKRKTKGRPMYTLGEPSTVWETVAAPSSIPSEWRTTTFEDNS